MFDADLLHPDRAKCTTDSIAWISGKEALGTSDANARER